jgi:hypothetical protein
VGTLLENVLCDRERREGTGPSEIEREMRDGFRSLRLRQAVIHRPVDVIGHLRDLSGRNQRADRDQAALARREVRSEPEFTNRNRRKYRR